MGPVAGARGKIGSNCLFLTGCVSHHFSTFADTLVWLDMGAGGHFLQEYLDGLRAVLALESKDTGRLGWHVA